MDRCVIDKWMEGWDRNFLSHFFLFRMRNTTWHFLGRYRHRVEVEIAAVSPSLHLLTITIIDLGSNMWCVCTLEKI